MKGYTVSAHDATWKNCRAKYDVFFNKAFIVQVFEIKLDLPFLALV